MNFVEVFNQTRSSRTHILDLSSNFMNPKQRRGMFANIQGHQIKLGSPIVINTGNKDRHVKLVEQHMGPKSKICVQYKGKKFLVSKSKVVL